MKVHSYAWSLLVMLALSFTFFSCDDDDNDIDDQTITEFAVDNPDFSTLVDALVAAGLDDDLDDRSASLTVFAPNNAAFSAFLADNGFATLNEVPVDVLRMVLMYHVLPTEATSDKLESTYYNTLAEFDEGAPLSLFIDTNGGVKINADVDVIAADEELDNGVIHTVDKVIAPANIVTLALSNTNFSSLIAALTRTDLSADFVQILSGEGPFTVFAPTNSAFEGLLASNNEWNTLDDVPVETLDAVLRYHVIAGANVRAEDIQDDADVTTFQGGSISIDLDGDNPVINAGSNTANIIATNVQGTNGVVHAIDAVLLP